MSTKALLLAMVALAAQAGRAAGGPPVDLTLFTANCYCFDEAQTRALRDLSWLGNQVAPGYVDVKDLQSGIQKDTGTRRREIANKAIGSQADFVFLQELWNDKNKDDMERLMAGRFKYRYRASGISRGPTETDDGLMVLSKWPPFFTASGQFKDRYDDERHAHKGYLLVGVYHPSGGFVLLVNTHLQSGTDDRSCEIREIQAREIAARIRDLARLDWRIENATVIVGGDTNDPITVDAPNHLLFDRTRHLVDAFNAAGIPVDNDQTVAFLCGKLGIREVYQGSQVTRQGAVRTVDLARPRAQWGSRPLPTDNSHLLRFNGNPANWSYFPWATEPSGRQMLDMLFLDPAKATLQSITVLRWEFLGDPGAGAHQGDPVRAYDAKTAISDHAGVLFRFRLAPSL